MLYDAVARSSTSIDVAALLDAPVIADGSAVPLRTVLRGERTLLLFVRNGA